VVGIAAYGAGTQPVDYNQKYWDTFKSSLTQGKSGNATYDSATPAAEQQYSARANLYQQLKAGPSTNDFGQKGAGLPPEMMQLAASYGMINPDGSVNKNWSQLQPAAPRYSAYGKLQPASTNTYYDPSMLAASGSQAGPGGRAY
jgi:hypothetical protein